MIRLLVLIVAIVIIFFHFVPVFNKTGVLDKGMANLCSHTTPLLHTYRLLPTGINAFHNDYKFFKSTAPGLGCAEPVKLRLYLW